MKISITERDINEMVYMSIKSILSEAFMPHDADDYSRDEEDEYNYCKEKEMSVHEFFEELHKIGAISVEEFGMEEEEIEERLRVLDERYGDMPIRLYCEKESEYDEGDETMGAGWMEGEEECGLDGTGADAINDADSEFFETLENVVRENFDIFD